MTTPTSGSAAARDLGAANPPLSEAPVRAAPLSRDTVHTGASPRRVTVDQGFFPGDDFPPPARAPIEEPTSRSQALDEDTEDAIAELTGGFMEKRRLAERDRRFRVAEVSETELRAIWGDR